MNPQLEFIVCRLEYTHPTKYFIYLFNECLNFVLLFLGHYLVVKHITSHAVEFFGSNTRSSTSGEGSNICKFRSKTILIAKTHIYIVMKI